jgi:hypothetical protein
MRVGSEKYLYYTRIIQQTLFHIFLPDKNIFPLDSDFTQIFEVKASICTTLFSVPYCNVSKKNTVWPIRFSHLNFGGFCS